MFDWLYKGIGAMLGWFSDITGSYAIALLLYALVFKIVFLPFSIKQQKNQIAMAKLTPKIEQIKAKYRGRTDQATMRKQQEEIFELQKKEGASPFGGCLPLLIQFPIIIFLYNVIRSPLSYIARVSKEAVVAVNTAINGTEAAFKSIDQIVLIGQIKNHRMEYGPQALIDAGLSPEQINNLPNFELFGMNLADKPAFTATGIGLLLILIPFLAAGFQWLTMFITRKLNGNANQLADQNPETKMSTGMMDIAMPLMTVFFAFSFSAMMGLYWIYQSILGIIQIIILAKVMPLPKFTEEEIKAMKKAQREQEKAQKNIIKTQPKYKSLHYIDDEDYDELPEVKSSQKKESKPISGQDRPEIKD